MFNIWCGRILLLLCFYGAFIGLREEMQKKYPSNENKPNTYLQVVCLLFFGWPVIFLIYHFMDLCVGFLQTPKDLIEALQLNNVVLITWKFRAVLVLALIFTPYVCSKNAEIFHKGKAPLSQMWLHTYGSMILWMSMLQIIFLASILFILFV